MRIRVVGSAVDGSPAQFAASYVINDEVAIDAGSLGFIAVEDQLRIKHVLLSHTHLDHVASLPIFIDNVYQPGPRCVRVHASSFVLECLQRSFFNGHVWPDVIKLSQEESPHVEFIAIEHQQALELSGLRITPVELNHTTPTFGFLVDDRSSAFVLVSDTGPTTSIWELANATTHLQAVFIESAFPNSMTWLADKTKHLTPELMRVELEKLKRDVPVVVVHIKPAHAEQVMTELKALKLPRLRISQPNHEYQV